MTTVIRRLLLVFTVVPLLGLLTAALSVNFAQGPFGGGLTLDWLAISLEENWVPLARSIGLAMLVTGCVLVLGGPLAWSIARGPVMVSRALSQLVDLPLALPGIAVSIALIGMFAPIRASGLLLLIGHVIYTLPFMVVSLVPAFAQRQLIESEEAARSLGARSWFILRTVTIPAASTSLLQGAATTFALSMGEFNVSFFVVPPASSTAPFALFASYTTGRLEIAAAQTVVFVLAVLPAVWLITRYDTRPARRKVSHG